MRSLLCLFLGLVPAAPPEHSERMPLVGYSELQANLTGGRHANIATMRACVVRSDGTERKELAHELIGDAHTWTQFVGWSPDGRVAVIGRGWESPENARWEEEHKQFRFIETGWQSDVYLLEMDGGRLTNVTAVKRVSFFNTGVFFWPQDPQRLGFQALIGGESHPFRMNPDGTAKEDLTPASKEFAYGFSASPDGKRIAYHKSYRVYVADADGSNARLVQTGQPFNFGPQWSPDGNRLLFLSGEHYACHPYVARADGSKVKKLASRGAYRGVVEFLDVPDFHGGSSDLPAWSTDGRSVFYTATLDDRVELMRATLDGHIERLTNSPAGTLHYHPQPSPDGNWLVFGSKRAGVRQLYTMRLQDKSERPLTQMKPGAAAMWPYWQRGHQ